MEKVTLQTPILSLTGIGPKVAEKLNRLGISAVEDLIFHIPHRYEDFSSVKKVRELSSGENVTIQARILTIESRRAWRRRNMMITEALAEDESGPVRVVWFNQPFLEETLKPNIWVSFSGKVSADKKGFILSNPLHEIIGSSLEPKETIHTGRLVPIYPETRGLTSRWLRYKIHELLNTVTKIEDFVPDFLLKEYKLITLDKALNKIHAPESDEDIEKARERLLFNDLFLLQLFVLEEKTKIKSLKGPQIKTDEKKIKKFVSSLPFKLTESQRKVTWQILKDLDMPHPMNRLLEGDVGSGKTIVAAIAAYQAMEAGWQVAFLAPTEILAEQHYAYLSILFDIHDFKIALLTASRVSGGKVVETKKSLVEKISRGEVSMVVGTHALIQKNVKFNNLGLVIVDEQHRFGVQQRAHLLRSKKMMPHLLSMSATPIPRTLALSLYGDLDLSLLTELPKGRQKIKTFVVPPSKREGAYGFIKKEVKKGRQVFVICPLIEESLALEVRSATQEYEKLSKNIFPDLKVGMLHGKMKGSEKQNVMEQFKSGETDILVSTAVVEVGIDVPNATIMMIEGADRFGLAQLHQFRGRVGRGEHPSYSLLFTDSTSAGTRDRLKAVVESSDGFALADKDLELRGPGQFFGEAQSGLPDLAMEGLKDVKMIERAQEAAKKLLENSKISDYPLLEEKMKTFTHKIHWE